ncbi:MAG TPA: 3-oxoadipate enol-lactonase [Vicinamibacterales bacterium]|nr:3-oxoadipate enol-lactonase [Vicinamibacterales bacterium]
MPLMTVAGNHHYYRLDGADDRPVLVFAHSLGLDHATWDAQAADLLPYFRILRYDVRGHGASASPPGDYSIAQLAQDVLAIADACGVDRFAFCGLSLGGMIGQWLAVHARPRLTTLVLANTTARVADPSAMEARRRAVLDGGMGAIEEMVMARFFSPAVIAANAPAIASARRTLRATNPIGYAGCCAAIRDMDQRAMLEQIEVRTLVISGDADVGMPWDAHGAVLTSSIAGAQVVRLPAAHISNLEKPRSFTRALMDFLVPPPGDQRESGVRVRREVLGADHVDRAIAATTDFTRAFQALIADVPWGTIWTRPGLDRRTRRLLVLTTTAAMGRWEEFRLHLRSGLAHELEPADVEEMLLQLAVYAGVPAANTAFKIAEECL